MLLSVKVSYKISTLFLLEENAECAQAIYDIIRVSIIFGIFVSSFSVQQSI
jgi:hypothetical protein